MIRVIKWGGVGGMLGFLGFGVLFFGAAPQRSPDRLLWVVFSIMAAVPCAGLGALFAAFVDVKHDLEEIRNELDQLHRIEKMIERLEANPSTQFKTGPFDRGTA